MVLNTTRTICHKCTQCDEFVTTKVSAFDIAGGVNIDCNCGSNDIMVKRDNSSYACAFSCNHCGRPHIRQISAKEFWAQTFMLTCGDCGSVACSIGNGDATTQLREAEIRHESETVANHVVAAIQDFSAQGKLSCECGNQKLNVKLGMRGIDLTCKRCGARKFIKACNEKDLDKFMKTKKIRLIKSESKIIQFFE